MVLEGVVFGVMVWGKCWSCHCGCLVVITKRCDVWCGMIYVGGMRWEHGK